MVAAEHRGGAQGRAVCPGPARAVAHLAGRAQAQHADQAHDAGVIGPAPGQRIEFFVENFRSELPALFEDPEPYVQALVERVSYITFFSRVLDYVPGHEPYAAENCSGWPC